MFCSKCGALINKNADGKFVCPNCGNEEKKKKNTSQNKIVTQTNVKEVLVIKSDDHVEPLDSEAVCPKCNHVGAYYVLKQTRAADEPETAIYTCEACGHRWREY